MKEKSHAKRYGIPVLTWTSALCGGLVLAYLGMLLLVEMIPGDAAGRLLIAMVLFPCAWTFAALWIFYSCNTRQALGKTIIGCLITACILIVTRLV